MSSSSTTDPMKDEELVVILHACAIGRADVLSKAIATLRANSPLQRQSLEIGQEIADILSNIRNENGESPLHCAAINGHSDVIRVLLSHGADPSIRIKKKKAFEIATDNAKKTFFSYLFERIAITDMIQIEKLLLGGVPTLFGNDSALIWACSFGYVDIVEMLLIYGAEVDYTDVHGNTALHIASKHDEYELVEILLNEDADDTIKNKQGQTAMDLSGSEKVMQLFQISREPSMKYAILCAKKYEEIIENEREQDAYEAAMLKRVLYESGFITEEEANAVETDEGEVNYHNNGDTIANEEMIDDMERISEVEEEEDEDIPKRALLLWPFPQRYEFPAKAPLFLNTTEILLVCVSSKSVDVFPLLTWSGFIELFNKLRVTVEVQRSSSLAKIRLSVDQALCPGLHRYHLQITSSYVSLIASDTTGLMYALQTFTQYIQLYGEIIENEGVSCIQLPAVEIIDWPDVLNRGVLWSYRESCLSSSVTLSIMVDVLSKLRLNRLILLINDEQSMRGEDDNSATIYLLDETCRKYCVDLIPAVILTSPTQHLSAAVLQNFSNTVLFLVFMYEEDELQSNHQGYLKAIKDTMLLAQSAGITSLNVAYAPWMSVLSPTPLDIASSLGLRAIEQSLDSLCSFHLSSRSLSSVESILENISRYSYEVYSKGLSSSILPGLLDSFFSSPLVLTKFYTFLHAGYSWNRKVCMQYFEHQKADLSIIKDVVRMILFPGQFYSRENASDVYHNTGVILNLLSNSSQFIENLAEKSVKLHHAENILWCILTSYDKVHACKVPSKAIVTECLRNYKRCLASSRWKLGVVPKQASPTQPETSEKSTINVDFHENLDADEFFCVMYMLCTLCKLILFGYNALEKKPMYKVETIQTLGILINALPVGSKSDLANTFLQSLEHSMVLWRYRFDHIQFSLNVGSRDGSASDALTLAKVHYLKASHPSFPAVKVIALLCHNLPIATSVDSVLQKIFDVPGSLFEN